MLDNQQPAYIVTEPALTSLHTSQLLTKQEYYEAQCVWGKYAFNVDAYSEELYLELFKKYVKSDEYTNRAFIDERFNKPDYIEAHKQFYEQMMQREDNWYETDDSVDCELLDKLCREESE